MTLTNPFPKKNEWWLLYPKKTAKVAVIEFLMTNHGGGNGLRVHLMQKGNSSIISLHI